MCVGMWVSLESIQTVGEEERTSLSKETDRVTERMKKTGAQVIKKERNDEEEEEEEWLGWVTRSACKLESTLAGRHPSYANRRVFRLRPCQCSALPR